MKYLYFSLFACASLLISGCAGEPALKDRAAHVSPERMYVEAMLPAASDIGDDWVELGRVIVARTRYGELDQVADCEKALKDFPALARGFLVPEGPCRIVSAVTYGKDSALFPAMTAYFYFQKYPALPLGEDEHLPENKVEKWERGADGLACGVAEICSEVSASGTTRIQPEIDDDEKVIAENKPAVTAKVAFTKICLAAHGVMVELHCASGVAEAEREKAVSGIRQRLARTLEQEKKWLEELAENRAKLQNKVILEEKANPEAGIYWDFLDKAMGNIYKKKY